MLKFPSRVRAAFGRCVINNDYTLLIFASDLLCRTLILYAKPDLRGKVINEETF